MNKLLQADTLVGGVSPEPTYPNVISFDLKEPLLKVNNYTDNLSIFDTPHELCVMKALELCSNPNNYDLNSATFRMELMAEAIDNRGHREVDAVMAAISSLCEYLFTKFEEYGITSRICFPYEFHALHMGRYLFLSKVILDAKLPVATPIFNPTTIAKPAYSYPGMRSHVGTPHPA